MIRDHSIRVRLPFFLVQNFLCLRVSTEFGFFTPYFLFVQTSEIFPLRGIVTLFFVLLYKITHQYHPNGVSQKTSQRKYLWTRIKTVERIFTFSILIHRYRIGSIFFFTRHVKITWTFQCDVKDRWTRPRTIRYTREFWGKRNQEHLYKRTEIG